jgi:DeoR/GlpR family transcriptional regulator of sugar metabolism
MYAGEQRRNEILQVIIREGYGSVQSLAESCGVSEMTVRRDMVLLESQGLIRRTHGGAFPEEREQIRVDYDTRQRQNAKAKRLIAQAAAEMVQDGQVIFLDAGTTVLAMTEFLLRRRGLTVITSSVPAAQALAGREGIEAILLGGTLRRDLMAVVGHLAQENLGSFRVDTAFLGTASLDPQRGLTLSTMEEIPLKKRAAAVAAQVVVLADRSKIGKAGVVYFLPPSQFHVLVTDSADAAEVIDLRGGGNLRELLAERDSDPFPSRSP